MPLISIPLKKATGTLNRRAKSFTPGGTGGLTILDITVNWQPNQSSGPVSFSFTLDQPSADGRFPAGMYFFGGDIGGPGSPCPGSLACGLINWPGSEKDEVPWEATGGPVDEEECVDEEEDKEEQSTDLEELSADTEEPYK